MTTSFVSRKSRTRLLIKERVRRTSTSQFEWVRVSDLRGPLLNKDKGRVVECVYENFIGKGRERSLGPRTLSESVGSLTNTT